jgi:PAS domain S-box-containing protein
LSTRPQRFSVRPVAGDSRRVDDARLRLLFDANVIGIIVGNNAGAIFDANDAFLELIGYSREDLANGLIDWRSMTPPEWLPLDELAIAAMAANGWFAPYEKEYVRADGTRVPVSVGGARVTGTADEQICYILDLSATRRAEAALRQSESRFKALADANVIGVLGARLADGTLVEVNDEFLRTLGYTRSDLEAGLVRWAEITPPDWEEPSRLAMQELMERGSFAPFEKEYLRRDGSRVPVLVGAALLEGPAKEIVCFVLDLSEQKEAARRLEAGEAQYRLLAEALPEIIMLTDENRRPTYVNKKYTDYTGLSLEELPGKWLEVVHPDDLADVAKARATGESYEVEYRLRRHDGVYRWHFARVLHVKGDGTAERWLGAAMDIDDRKRAEEALRFIEKAGTLLSRSLDLETTFETLMDLVVPEFGDWSAINLRDDDGAVKTYAVRHADPEKDALARRLQGVNYYNESPTWGTAAAFLSGKPQLHSHVTPEDMRNAVSERYLPILEELGFGSVIALPIFVDEEVIGSFGIVSIDGRRRYTEADLPPLEELARRAGFAVKNARQYEREHRVASVLQEAALPQTLPIVANLHFDGYYRAGRKEASIGGDWYDVLVVSDGRIVISVGDVAGSGLNAAILMSNIRQVIRGAATVSADPMLVLDVADRTLRSEHDDRMATAFVGVLDPSNGTMVYASAGHLPALVRAPDGTISELNTPGLPLGYRGMAVSESRTTILPPGSRLLLYTDGLVEWSRDIYEGERLLRKRLAAVDGLEAEHPARSIVDSVLPPDGARDDVAALVVDVAEKRR